MSEEDIVKNYYCACGIALNLIMDGELEKTDEFLDSLPKNDIFDFIKLTLSIVHPKTTWKIQGLSKKLSQLCHSELL